MRRTTPRTPGGPRPAAGRRRAGPHGLALVEVLVALVLFALAGAVVASAATVNFRAMRLAARRGTLVAVAERELARLQAGAIRAGHSEAPLAVAGSDGTVRRETRVDDDGMLATLAVTVAAVPGGPQVRLTTRAILPW